MCTKGIFEFREIVCNMQNAYVGNKNSLFRLGEKAQFARFTEGTRFFNIKCALAFIVKLFKCWTQKTTNAILYTSCTNL